MEPILHLSLPVRDLAESVDFYKNVLGCRVGREREDFVDVWFFGMQVTLHDEPGQVLSPEQRGVHHFGVAVGPDELAQLVARAEAHQAVFVSELSTDYRGTPREQTKAKILDPSGYAIELKTYVDPDAAFFG